MNEYNPKVSIIIPVYNGSNFLEEAIQSALKQTYNNIEIIIVNDGSNDDGATERVAKKYDDKIRYFYKENGGVSSALNYGISQMTGEWFSWLSHDDLYMPEKIAHSIRMMCEHRKLGKKLIIYTDGCLIRENGTEIKPFKKYFDIGKLYSGMDAASIMTAKGTLCGCCLLIHKDAFQEVGLFDESLRYSQDALMWYKLFMNGYSLCSCGGKLVHSRVHKNQVTNTRKDLFLKDSLYIAKILAPIFAEKDSTSGIYYNYTKRKTKQNCKNTVDYLIDYARENQILSKSDLFKLKIERVTGHVVYLLKAIARRLVS